MHFSMFSISANFLYILKMIPGDTPTQSIPTESWEIWSLISFLVWTWFDRIPHLGITLIICWKEMLLFIFVCLFGGHIQQWSEVTPGSALGITRWQCFGNHMGSQRLNLGQPCKSKSPSHCTVSPVSENKFITQAIFTTQGFTVPQICLHTTSRISP